MARYTSHQIPYIWMEILYIFYIVCSTSNFQSFERSNLQMPTCFISFQLLLLSNQINVFQIQVRKIDTWPQDVEIIIFPSSNKNLKPRAEIKAWGLLVHDYTSSAPWWRYRMSWGLTLMPTLTQSASRMLRIREVRPSPLSLASQHLQTKLYMTPLVGTMMVSSSNSQQLSGVAPSCPTYESHRENTCWLLGIS